MASRALRPLMLSPTAAPPCSLSGRDSNTWTAPGKQDIAKVMAEMICVYGFPPRFLYSADGWHVVEAKCPELQWIRASAMPSRYPADKFFHFWVVLCDAAQGPSL